MKLDDTDCKGQFQEGIVHGHIHNFNNMTYIHGHIHHNASHLPNLNASTVPTNVTTDMFKDRNSANKNIQISNDFIENSSSPFDSNAEKALESDFMDCEHFEFMDTNGTLPDRFSNNFNNSFFMDTAAGDATNWDKKNLLESHPYDLSNNNSNGGGPMYSKSKSRDHRVSLSDDMLNLPLSKKRRLSGSSEGNQDNCPCNPKMVEICCDVDHTNMSSNNPAVENISLNTHPNFMVPNDYDMHNLSYHGATSPPSLQSKNFYQNNFNNANTAIPVSPSTNFQSNESNKVGQLNNDFAKQFLDLNCDLTCEPSCLDKEYQPNSVISNHHNNNTTDTKQGNNPVKQENTKINIKKEPTDTQALPNNVPVTPSIDGKEDMLETFYKACQRVGESNENANITKPLNTGIDTTVPHMNHLHVNDTNQYHKHTSNRQLDMQIISDICAISSLYEMPLADHMNHHHHKHSAEPQSTDQPIPRSESFNLLESVVNCKPTRVLPKGKNTSTRLPQVDQQQQLENHNHHHHKIQFHDHNTTPFEQYQSDKTVSWERFKKDYKGSSNKLEREYKPTGTNSANDDTLILYHHNEQRSMDQVKLEPLNTIHFNWNFKTNDQASENIECKWDNCRNDYNSLIELQRHLFNDHITEYNLPLNPSNDPSKDPVASCKWESCDFKSKDVCSFVNHVNSKHGINFDMEFVDSKNMTTNQKFNGMKNPHHMYHCKNTDCQTSTSPESTTAQESITSVDYTLSPNTVGSNSNNTTTVTNDRTLVKEETPYIMDISKDHQHTKKSEDNIIHCKWLDCTATFNNEAELDHHLESFHIPKGQSSYQCHWTGCGRTLPTRQKMVRHIRKHSGDKPFKCMECSKCFATKESLKQHGRTHTGERPFKCPYCDKTFASSTFVNIHVRMHTGEKPLECPYCQKRFSESSNLNKHIKTHLKKFKDQNTNNNLTTGKRITAHKQNM
ncbi:similar to Saccharomyces cerevisiae YJL056C ZAP1 Zinc-regulated transcription factor [Maudiozyma saulgeensis]|uniref:Similar to Saccharomyces cerevisiae YJL056C ZAP1 Zinc-regulated transcription factor n=1 Tax=Maudiozyma saulgeensis TaxID=1789683 RepID=A0A1X7R399_9SACH|nr:similar to Saccharomyces cerevisiae YJL056C ZAP1 Zinc-regulated transcription factor [Kazachstania saulgeensis]